MYSLLKKMPGKVEIEGKLHNLIMRTLYITVFPFRNREALLVSPTLNSIPKYPMGIWGKARWKML